jgi:TRAP-type mannitol/chloroaromatic compound transport system permease small subunit
MRPRPGSGAKHVPGSLLALVSVVASLALVLQGSGGALVFATLGIVLAGLALAGWLRPLPGLASTAAVLAAFAFLIVAPFSATRQQLNLLRRAARQGDESAQSLIEFYGVMEPFAGWLMLLGVATIVALFVVAAVRHREGAMAFLLRESEALATAVSRIGMVAAFTYLPLMLIIVYDVLQRKYLDVDPGFTRTAWYQIFTSTRLQELEWHLHAALFLLCLAYAYVRDAHVRIEIVRERLRPRPRVWIELLGCLLFLVPYCYVVVLYGSDFAQKSFAIMERSSAQTGLGMRFIIKSVLPIGFTLLALAGVSVALKCIVYLFGPPGLRNASSFYAGVHHADLPPEILAAARPGPEGRP